MLLVGLPALDLAPSRSSPNLPVVAPNRWVVDHGRTSCTLARRIAGNRFPA
ncbi:MAG: hypothetical protein ACXWUR_07245 [Allosphingosinicella sp.]